MKKPLCVMILASALGIAGCDISDSSDSDDDYSADYSSGGGGGNGGGGSGSGGGSYNWSYTCDVSGTQQVPIPRGSCEQQYKDYAQAFGCNYVEDMNAAACALEQCTGEPKACGGYPTD
jgi:hypothetical protein